MGTMFCHMPLSFILRPNRKPDTWEKTSNGVMYWLPYLSK